LEGKDMTKTVETKKKKFSFKKWIIKHAPAICLSFAAFVLLVGVLLMTFRAKEELVQYSIENENVYMYVQDARFDFNTKITLDHEEQVTNLHTLGTSMELNSEPLYFEEKEEAIFPKSMGIILPIEGQLQKKLNRYTVVNAEGIQPLLTNQGLKYALTNGFMYDGGNLYFFVEKGTLTWGTESVELSPMSFVTCDYYGDLSYYNYETKEVRLIENVKTDVVMNFERYKINLSYDTVEVGKNSFILQKNVEALPVLTQ
jgi:hypothetical protein